MTEMEEYPHLPIVEVIPNPENDHDDVNDHDHVGSPMSEKDASPLTSQTQNQSSLDNIGSDENINTLEAQLQSLRIDSIVEGLLERNSINQQTLAGNLRIRPSRTYEGALYGNNIINQQTLVAGNSEIGPSYLYERSLHGNNTINQQTPTTGNFRIGQSYAYEGALRGNNITNQQTLAVGNSGIRLSHLYERSLHGNHIINQQTPTAGNFRIGPSYAYEGALRGNNIINQQSLAVGNSGIGLSHLYERSLHGNDIINQQTLAAGNSGVGQSHVYKISLNGNDIINQQTLAAGNSRIGPSHVYERSPHGNNIINQQTLATAGGSWIEPSHVYEGALHGNNIIDQQTLATGNSWIGPSDGYESSLHRNNIINQQTLVVGNLGIGPSHVYEGALDGNIINQQILTAGDSGISPSHAYNSSSIGRMLMRHRYNNITSLEVVRGRVVSMSKEEDGSEFLVRVLDGKNPGDIKFILREVSDHLHNLMKDWFGKRVIEKLFDVLDVYQATPLFESITENMFLFQIVCENEIGCKVIQSMIDHFTIERQIIVFKSVLEKIAVSLATSRYGGYVLHHFLKRCPSFSKDILDALVNEFTHIATDRTGCSILQKYLLESSFLLIREVSNCVSLLAPHPYGNYVVQYVIRLMYPAINEEIVNRLRGLYVELSLGKHGSNVVEKLLLFSTQKNVGIIVQEIMHSPRFLELLRDDYGNYVAQRALECSQGDLYHALEIKILGHFTNLYAHRFGRRVLTFMHGGRK